MDGGRWSQGWLLTGLPDPCRLSRFAPPPNELAAVSGYIKAKSEIRKAAVVSIRPEVDNFEEVEQDLEKEKREEAVRGGGCVRRDRIFLSHLM